MTDDSHERRVWLKRLMWLLGLGALAAVIVVAVRHAEAREFAEMVKRASPIWLLAAFALQVGTYALQGEAWYAFLRRHGKPPPRALLFQLSVLKLFVDQVLPTASISGSAVMVKGLERRGTGARVVMAAVVVETVAYYIGYSLAVTGAALLMPNGRTKSAFLIAAGIVVAVTLAMGWGMERLATGKGIRLGALARVPGFRTMKGQLERADSESMRDRTALIAATLLQLGIHVLDAATLCVLLLGVGTHAPPLAVLLAFMLASLVRTVGIVPGGLGTFEAVCVTSMRAAGVSVSAALAATLLFRGLSFWLPMLPGWWLARHEAKHALG